MAFNSCVSVTTPAPLAMTIPASQWSGGGSDYYVTVNASNITADSILIPHYDEVSAAYLNGLIWCVPAAGSFTIHTSAIPSGSITVLIQFAGTNGDAQYQVLADVYSTSQALAKADVVDGLASTATNVPLSAKQGKVLDEGKVNYSDIVNSLTSTATDAPLSAAQGKVLNDTKLNKSDVTSTLIINSTAPVSSGAVYNTQTLNQNTHASGAVVYRVGRICYITCVSGSWYSSASSEPIRKDSATATEWVVAEGFRPVANCEISEARYSKRITVMTDGKVICSDQLSGTTLRFCGCYICA